MCARKRAPASPASVKALRYSPNLAARSLASADAMHLGILYSNPSAAYLSEFLLGSLEQSSISGQPARDRAVRRRGK